MKSSYSIGDKVITKNHKENGVVIGFIGSDNKLMIVKLDRFDDVEVKCYAHDVEPWKPRRFQVNGDHYKKMIDQANPEAGTTGTWAVRDTFRNEDVFYITSGHSKSVAQQICDAMNEGTLLQTMKM